MKKYIMTIPMALVFSIGALAAESSPTQKELREQMAQAHEKMALCLRSEVPVEDCHQQMREQCRDNMGDGACMMGKMGKGTMRKFKKNDSPKGK